MIIMINIFIVININITTIIVVIINIVIVIIVIFFDLQFVNLSQVLWCSPLKTETLFKRVVIYVGN